MRIAYLCRGGSLLASVAARGYYLMECKVSEKLSTIYNWKFPFIIFLQKNYWHPSHHASLLAPRTSAHHASAPHLLSSSPPHLLTSSALHLLNPPFPPCRGANALPCILIGITKSRAVVASLSVITIILSGALKMWSFWRWLLRLAGRLFAFIRFSCP